MTATNQRTTIAKLNALALTIGLIGTSAASALNIQVPGSANPWLAGATNGTIAAGGDVAPSQSPVVYTDFTTGSALQFSATGSAGYSPGVESGPDGITGYFVSDPVQNGIGGLNNAQANALLGVFLDNSVPQTADAVPNNLDFGPSGLLNYELLQPALRQPFAIGSGFATNGVQRTIIAPAGATRLFLGTCDGSGWFNNPGSFSVDISGGLSPFCGSFPPARTSCCIGRSVYTNFTLQANADLATSTWLSVTNAHLPSGSDWTVTVPGNTGKKFFRLISQ